MRSSTETPGRAALRVPARDIESGNGVTNPAEYPKIKVINKSLMAVQWHAGGPRHVTHNVFEATKAYCLAAAKGLPVELPYLIDVMDYRFEGSHPDLFRWKDDLTSDNPPHPVQFRGRFEEYRALVEPIDFAAPFDARACRLDPRQVHFSPRREGGGGRRPHCTRGTRP